MTPIKQTIIYNEHTIGNGDCRTACYASLLDVPLWYMPPFHQMYGRSDYDKRITEWFAAVHKMERKRIICINMPGEHDEGDLALLRELPEFYICEGPTIRGGHHAVVYSGDRSIVAGPGHTWNDMWPSDRMVHDPHSSDAGLTGVWTIEYFKPL